MMKTYTKEEVTSGHDLTHYMNSPFKGATSVFVHPGESDMVDLTVNIEAYDDTFYEVTKNPSSLDRLVDRVNRNLTKIFPNMLIEVVWYSGFVYHRTVYLDTHPEEKN